MGLGECIIKWKSFDKDGYARVWLPRTYNKPRKYMRANRYVWQQHYGNIPDGMCVMHKCDNPSCVNIDHLSIGTISDNNTDKKLKGRSQNQLGERNPGSKLTNMQTDIIRLASNIGCKQEWLADYYNVSRPLISLIKTGTIRNGGIAISQQDQG